MTSIAQKKAVAEAAYANGLLVPETHGRLLDNLDNLTEVAGIRNWQSMVWTPLSDVCGPAEIAWAREYKTVMREKHKTGVLYHGNVPAPSVEERMYALTGCFLRNFVDARVMVLSEVLLDVKQDVPMDYAVLMIPDFFIEKASGGDLPEWKRADLLGLLRRCARKGIALVLYIEDVDKMAHQYGKGFKLFLDQNMVALSI